MQFILPAVCNHVKLLCAFRLFLLGLPLIRLLASHLSNSWLPTYPTLGLPLILLWNIFSVALYHASTHGQDILGPIAPLVKKYPSHQDYADCMMAASGGGKGEMTEEAVNAVRCCTSAT